MNIALTKIRRHILEQFFTFLAEALELSPYLKTAHSNCEKFPDIVYGFQDEKRQQLDIYRPVKSPKRLPVLIYYHGGGFSICSKQTHRGIALTYANNGYLVVNVDYRIAPKNPFPAAIEDACSAYIWTVENIHKYGGDENRVSLAGESAGANLALAVTIATCYQRPEPYAKKVWATNIVPKASQILCGMLQVSSLDRLVHVAPKIHPTWFKLQHRVAKDVTRSYLGHADIVHSKQIEMADPLVILEKNNTPDRPIPKLFAMVGTADILLNDTYRLETALKKIDCDYLAKYYPNEPHAFQALPWRKNTRIFWEDSFQFLNKFV